MKHSREVIILMPFQFASRLIVGLVFRKLASYLFRAAGQQAVY